MKKVVVVGGGAAGMMAAATAAENGAQVTLLERNEKLGKKLYITGKGRCNLTNDCDKDTFFKNIPHNAKFLYGAFSALSCQDLMHYIEKTGVPLKVERGNRVFPVSDKSSDIIRAFEKLLRQYHVEILYHQRVSKIVQNEAGRVIGVETEEHTTFECDAVILCTGGTSYPQTGSTGDGYAICQQLGHTIEPLYGSLVPIESNEKWVHELQGLSLKNVTLSAYDKGKLVYQELGELLFTHFGISGPLVLTLSAHILNKPLQVVKIALDLKPGLRIEQLDARLLRDFEIFSRKYFRNALDQLLPQKLIERIIQLSGISPDKPVNQITKTERANLCQMIKNLEIPISGLRPIEEAVITRGGVSLKEIHASSMSSKCVKGLYFAGEILDVDGLTGGFNLQIAFSTGYLAGKSCLLQE